MTAVRMAGPILRNGEMAQAVVEAIREDNPDTKIVIGDHHGYIRIEGEEGLTLKRLTLEEILGRPFQMAEIEILMTGFSGKIDMSSDHVRWYFKSAAASRPAVAAGTQEA